MITLLRLKLPETLRAVAPLIGVVCVLQFTVVGASPAVFLQFLAGSTLVTLGLLLLFTGVGLFVAVALLRVVRGFSMAWQLTVVYGLMIALSFVAPSEMVPLAYDAGSVTTGVLTSPVVLALALGVSAVLAERSAVEDGFGLLGLASVGPIVVILLLGWLER
jgi:hypothetical protein